MLEYVIQKDCDYTLVTSTWQSTMSLGQNSLLWVWPETVQYELNLEQSTTGLDWYSPLDILVWNSVINDQQINV